MFMCIHVVRRGRPIAWVTEGGKRGGGGGGGGGRRGRGGGNMQKVLASGPMVAVILQSKLFIWHVLKTVANFPQRCTK